MSDKIRMTLIHGGERYEPTVEAAAGIRKELDDDTAMHYHSFELSGDVPDLSKGTTVAAFMSYDGDPFCKTFLDYHDNEVWKSPRRKGSYSPVIEEIVELWGEEWMDD